MREFEVDEQSGRLYIVWDGDMERGEQEIGVKMLMNNQIPGIVPISCQYVDEVLRVYYETAEMISIDKCYQEKNIAVKAANEILQAVIKAIQAGEPYFMARENFILSEKYIFMNRDGGQIWICYVPDAKQEIYGGLKRVMEFLLRHVEHGERSEEAFVYGIYDMICEQSHTLEELRECLERQSVVSQKDRDRQGVETAPSETVQTDVKYTAPLSLLHTIQKTGKDLSQMLVPHEIPLQGKRFRIGRQLQQDICLVPEQISREHAVLYCEGGKLQIEDKNSLNGTYINGRKISAHVKVHCGIGDIITFADIPYKIVTR